MLLYNITIKVDWRVHDLWLTWMFAKYIPFAINTQCFTKSQLVKLLEINDDEGPTYALQLYAESKASYNRYVEIYLPQIDQFTSEKWGSDVLSFSTLMQVVEPDFLSN